MLLLQLNVCKFLSLGSSCSTVWVSGLSLERVRSRTGDEALRTRSLCPRDICQVILRRFDKIRGRRFPMSPVLHALKYFDNFNKVILTITAKRGLCTSERFKRRSTRQDEFALTWLVVRRLSVRVVVVYIYINRCLALWWWWGCWSYICLYIKTSHCGGGEDVGHIYVYI